MYTIFLPLTPQYIQWTILNIIVCTFIKNFIGLKRLNARKSIYTSNRMTTMQIFIEINKLVPGLVAQSVTWLATDASLTANSGVTSSIPARSHTFLEINHEIISMVILLPSAESFKKGCCQLQAKVCAQSTG